jgi:hypothetical protein
VPSDTPVPPPTHTPVPPDTDTPAPTSLPTLTDEQNEIGYYDLILPRNSIPDTP